MSQTNERQTASMRENDRLRKKSLREYTSEISSGQGKHLIEMCKRTTISAKFKSICSSNTDIPSWGTVTFVTDTHRVVCISLCRCSVDQVWRQNIECLWPVN